MNPITTHVLDTARDIPAQGLPVQLEFETGLGRWRTLACRATELSGRVSDLVPEGRPSRGFYRQTFDTTRYSRARKLRSFYPSISVPFEIGDAAEHYHVPQLLSPFGYSTYRGD